MYPQVWLCYRDKELVSQNAFTRPSADNTDSTEIQNYQTAYKAYGSSIDHIELLLNVQQWFYTHQHQVTHAGAVGGNWAPQSCLILFIESPPSLGRHDRVCCATARLWAQPGRSKVKGQGSVPRLGITLTTLRLRAWPIPRLAIRVPTRNWVMYKCIAI